MRRVLVVLLLMSATAHAGPVLSLAGGAAPTLDGEVSGLQVDTSGGVGRVTIGERYRFAAIELGIGGFGVAATIPNGMRADGLAITSSLSAVLRAPIHRSFGAYARGGVERNWIGPTPAANVRLTGDGYLAGGGLDWGRTLAMFAELDREWLSVSAQGMTFHGTVDSLIAGVRIGM
jgi:hypothetical protein